MHEFRYSTRSSGDMRSPQNREAFLKQLSVDYNRLVLPEQVHGNRVATISNKEAGMKMTGVDGLVSGDDSLILGVLAADCVPLIFVDPKKRLTGVAHAGWRGTIANIAASTVDAMNALGSHPEDIIVSVGPHIGVCCYDVPEERASKFQHVFGDDVVHEEKNHWQLDLGKANYDALVRAGIRPAHIETSSVCTSCLSKEYFSYRKDDKKTFGEIIGIVVWN